MAEKKLFVLRDKNGDLSKKWYIEYYDREGKRKQPRGTINQHKTLEARYEAAKKLIEELKIKYKELTIKEKIFQKLEDDKGFIEPSSYVNFRSYMRRLFERCSNNPSVKEVEQFFIWLSQNRHANTYRSYRQTLSRYFRKVGLEEQYFKNIPFGKKKARTPARFFQAYQKERIRKHLKEHDPEMYLMISFMYYQAMRPKSIRLLQAGHILLSDSRILVTGAMSKNGKQRYSRIVKAFRPQLEHIRNMKANEWLFPDPEDPSKPIRPKEFSKRFRKILNELGFGNEYKLYSWRHTGAKDAVMAGVNLKELQIHFDHHSLDQFDQYLRQIGVADLMDLEMKFPSLEPVKKGSVETGLIELAQLVNQNMTALRNAEGENIRTILQFYARLSGELKMINELYLNK